MKLKNGYECTKDWPEGCFVQGDDVGVVIGRENSSRETAFFEAFPAVPNSTFIRGEGETLEQAESEAFEELYRYLSCPGHEFERKDTSGKGKCKHCAIEVSDVFESSEKCEECEGSDAGLREDKNNYCASCYYRTVAMGAYHSARLADVSPDVEPLDDEEWGSLAFRMLSTRAYFMLFDKGDLDSLITRKILGKVRKYRTGGGSNTQSKIRDIAIKYMLNAPSVGEDYARFFTEGKANRMLACPDLNDAIVSYHYDIKNLMDAGTGAQEAHDANHDQFVEIATNFAQDVLVEGAMAHKNNTIPESAVRARTKEEREKSIGDVIGALFGALGGKDEKSESTSEDKERRG